MKELVIAKTPHRTFEIYAIRDEATQALTPKNPARFDYEGSTSSTYRQLSVSQQDCVLHIQFANSQEFSTETLDDLREDFQQLSQKMGMNSRVLIDFEGVNEFCPDSIDVIADFNKRVRNKGSRTVLCRIDAAVLENFFPKNQRAG